jgi:hypothetical protein
MNVSMSYKSVEIRSRVLAKRVIAKLLPSYELFDRNLLRVYRFPSNVYRKIISDINNVSYVNKFFLKLVFQQLEDSDKLFQTFYIIKIVIEFENLVDGCTKRYFISLACWSENIRAHRQNNSLIFLRESGTYWSLVFFLFSYQLLTASKITGKAK